MKLFKALVPLKNISTTKTNQPWFGPHNGAFTRWSYGPGEKSGGGERESRRHHFCQPHTI